MRVDGGDNGADVCGSVSAATEHHKCRSDCSVRHHEWSADAPPGFQSKKIPTRYFIGKYDPENLFFKESPRTNTFVLFLKPDDSSKEWCDVTRSGEAFVEATEENVRMLEAKLGLSDSLEKSRHQKTVLVVITIFGIAALIGVGIFWNGTLRRAQKTSSVV